MREIKFRAWDDRQKVWLLGYELPNLGGFSLFGETVLLGEWSATLNLYSFERNDRKHEDLKVMQFTGLKDKNGKEIYEGDVVHCEDEMYAGAGDRAKRFSTNENQVISFENGAFRFDEITLGDMLGPGAHPLIFEVIGNIYENPELLDPPCKSGLAPHDYATDDQGDQVDLKCRNCGHVKAK